MSGARGEDGSISERVYRLLMRAYPKEFREMYGRQMEQAFLDLCREETRRGGVGLARFWVRVGLDLASSAIVERRCAEAKEIAVKDYKMAYRSAVRVALATAFILLLPLLAMQITDEVVWDLADFAFAGALLFGIGLTYELVARKGSNIAYRSAVGVALAAAFILVWLVLAVGVIGRTGDLADLMYIGVLAVGIIGALIARFRPHGMARVLFVTALGQALVAVIALIFGLGSGSPPGVLGILILNGFFVALFVGSALLFRYAAREQTPAGAGPEG